MTVSLAKKIKSMNLPASKELECFCQRHGRYMAVATVLGNRELGRTNCPKCFEEQSQRIADEAKAKEDIAAKASKTLSEQRNWDEAGIPINFKNRSLLDYSPQEKSQHQALELARRFVRGFDKAREQGYGITYLGASGTGKTHLACSILKELVGRASIRYAKAEDLLTRIKTSWSFAGNGNNRFDVMREYTDPDLLVIDNLGVHDFNQNTLTIIYSILSMRADECRPTICLSPLSSQQLATAIGEKSYLKLLAKSVIQIIRSASTRPTTLQANVFD